MQKAILESFPNAEITASIVWIEMLPGDNLAAAQKMADTVHDTRVRHYYDPRATRLAGHAFSRGLLNDGAGPAWDIYLFYDREAEWKDDPPKPFDWMHQLSGTARADPRRLHTGDDLIEQLRQSMERATGLKPGPKAE